MWVEKITLENIKCFENTSIRCGTGKAPHKWVTLLGENGGGKSTVLQSMGLLLAGPEGALQLTGNRRLEGWLKDESEKGKMSLRIHKDDADPGDFGVERKRNAFGYTFFVTGRKPLKIRNKQYSEPGVVENSDKILTWLRRHALLSKGKGWFAAGYGPFRRLSQKPGQRVVPSLLNPDRYSNFLTQFDEGEPLSRFEQWMVLLDYQIAKNSESGKLAQQQRDMGTEAINRLLPEDSSFEEVDENGMIWFKVGGNRVPTQNLSDGFRSVLALAGDLIWRMLEAYPNSSEPLKEPGVVLIDELDIHLHPIWQREIPGILREVFPNIQFIVATHSPLIAAGAGKDAVTYRIRQEGGEISVDEIDNIAFKSVDDILQSDAFGLVSPYSPEAEKTMQSYLKLKNKKRQSASEVKKMKEIAPRAKEMLGRQKGLFDDEETKLREEIIEHLKKSYAR